MLEWEEKSIQLGITKEPPYQEAALNCVNAGVRCSLDYSHPLQSQPPQTMQLMFPVILSYVLDGCRWLRPLAHQIGTAMEAQLSSETTEMCHGRQHGHDRLEGSPSLRGCEERDGGGDSQAPTQLNDQPQADDADSHQVMLFFLR